MFENTINHRKRDFRLREMVSTVSKNTDTLKNHGFWKAVTKASKAYSFSYVSARKFEIFAIT